MMNAMNRRSFLTTMAVGTAAGLVTDLRAQTKPRYKIIGFTKPFQKLGHDECAQTVAEIGWDGIECPVRPKGQIEPEKAADELPKLVEALKKRGKEITLLTTGIKAPDAESEKLLRTMKGLGIQKYRAGFFMYDSKRPIADQAREMGSALKDLAAMNKEIGVTGGVQNHSGANYFGAPVWDLWSAIKDLDPQALGCFFDIGHATIEGGLSWPTEARLMQRHMMTVAVKDFVWEKAAKGAKSKWVLLGQGNINRDFFTWLKTTDFSGPISHHAEYDHGKGPEMVAKLKKDMAVLRDWLGQ